MIACLSNGRIGRGKNMVSPPESRQRFQERTIRRQVVKYNGCINGMNNVPLTLAFAKPRHALGLKLGPYYVPPLLLIENVF